MKIAVIGAGLAGLSFAWHYQNLNPNHHLTVFDPTAISLRTSAMANLLYPYIGIHSKLNWHGKKAFDKSVELFEAISKKTGKKVYQKKPLLKLASYDKQANWLKQASLQYEDIQWQEQTSYSQSGVLITSAIQVDPLCYLDALEQACRLLGVQFKLQVFDMQNCTQYDRVILTAGFKTNDLLQNPIAFSYLKGQVLQLSWPAFPFNLDHYLIADKLHLTTSIDKKSLYVGNTFDRGNIDNTPSIDDAIEAIWPQLTPYFPNLEKKLIQKVYAGVRLNAPHRLPLLGPIAPSTWLFTALGSKGLLYHAYLGECLARAITTNSVDQIPLKVRYLPS